jgi:outer membrane PBP1 activator LpoA protein
MKNNKIRIKSALYLMFALFCGLLVFGCSGSAFIKTNEVLVADGQAEKAIANYRQELSQNPENHEIIYHLAKVLLKTKNFDQAYQEISKAILLEPQVDDYRLLAGKIAFAKKDYFNATNQLINA